MPEDTMSMYGGVEGAIQHTTEALKKAGQDLNTPAVEKQVLEAAKEATTHGNIKEADLLHLIRFRNRMEDWQSEVFRGSCHYM